MNTLLLSTRSRYLKLGVYYGTMLAGWLARTKEGVHARLLPRRVLSRLVERAALGTGTVTGMVGVTCFHDDPYTHAPTDGDLSPTAPTSLHPPGFGGYFAARSFTSRPPPNLCPSPRPLSPPRTTSPSPSSASASSPPVSPPPVPPLPAWVKRLPPSTRPYLLLARLDKPIGTYLLLWPSWWSIALAADSGLAHLPWTNLGLFGLGAVLLRGAGCTINDIWDRDLDRSVARTKHRPVASGAVSVPMALGFLGTTRPHTVCV